MQEVKTFLGTEDIDKIIKQATYLRDVVVIRLLARLGCRVTELVNIKVSDIDWDKGLILIQHLKTGIRKQCPSCKVKVGRKHNFCPKCGADISTVTPTGEQVKKRLIPVDQETLGIVKKYLHRRSSKSDRVVPLSRQTVYFVVQDLAQKAGFGGSILLNPDNGRLKKVSPHRFRDAFAIHALTADGTVEGQIHLQRHLGHKSFDTTSRYIKYSPSREKKWYDEIWKDEK